jgi:Na+/proline symporter
MQDINWVALIVFVALFGFITWLGFAAAHWRRGDLDLLNEWGLGGRRFGTLIAWFLIGGDLYTAYTFIAVPALAFGTGALAFFAVPGGAENLRFLLTRSTISRQSYTIEPPRRFTGMAVWGHRSQRSHCPKL